jgi:hypothetical protein|tara:strand:- start:1099 stop:1608 length:510 start_codon:yes stop_codon:yes gene_type:complete
MKKLIFTILILLSLEVSSQNSVIQEELLLYSQFGEFCTMCEAVLLCEEGEEKSYNFIPNTGNFTLYHLRTRTFLSQISTIWEFFIKNFDGYEIKGHKRPVNIITIDSNQWSKSMTSDAEISIDPGLIYIEDRMINRVNNEWMNNANESIGFCYRLPLWASIEKIDKKTN